MHNLPHTAKSPGDDQRYAIDTPRRATPPLAPPQGRGDRDGFTLVELLVVITVIVILLALLAPAMDKAIREAEKAVCASNEHGIAAGSTLYATQNKGVFFICRSRAVPVIFDALGTYTNFSNTTFSDKDGWNVPGDEQVDWLAALAMGGLASAEKVDVGGGIMQHQPLAKLWQCPSLAVNQVLWFPPAASPQTSPGSPLGTVVNNGAYGVGYQYLGGVMIWRNPFQRAVSRSPVKLSKSEGSWAIAADASLRLDGVWGTMGWPAHGQEPGVRSKPTGGNNAYVDGSVSWYGFDEMIFITSWNTTVRDLFFRQSDLGDYRPPPQAYGKDSRWN